jgi:hypothetical protein
MVIFSLTNITLLTALALSSIAAWYSILGLTAIFAAATIPIIIMGGILEIAKVVTTVWLHRYWTQAKWAIKVYLVMAVFGLALLTSIGVFGFLSKAHIDQGVPTSDVSAKISLLDERIKIQKENITLARNALAQMDAQVNARLDRGGSEQGAERAVQIRRQQQTERNKLLKEINDAQITITKLNEDRAPIASEFRKVEAEVGPIKYIAALLYDEESNKDSLERAVRWLILLIVFVFDPLALTLVLAANASRVWDKEKDKIELAPHNPTADTTPQFEESARIHPESEPSIEIEHDTISEINIEIKKPDIVQHSYLSKPYIHFPTDLPHIPNPAIDIDKLGTDKEEPQETPLTSIYNLPYKELPGGYATYKGKHMSMSALQQSHPELFLIPDVPKKDTLTSAEDSAKAQILYSEKYIQHLINRIESGDYDVQLLSEPEKVQIEKYLKNKA